MRHAPWDEAEWRARIAAGYVACDGPQRHRGVCSERRDELGGRTCIDLNNERHRLGEVQPTLFGSGDRCSECASALAAATGVCTGCGHDELGYYDDGCPCLACSGSGDPS